MKLFEHPDFDQLVLRADEHFRPRGLRPAIIEKDYYVTEALRIIAASKERVIFKGGTSLSKGWNLIDRFTVNNSVNNVSIRRKTGRYSRRVLVFQVQREHEMGAGQSWCDAALLDHLLATQRRHVFPSITRRGPAGRST